MSLLIGWGEIDITPNGTVDLAGQYYHRPATQIHSRLTATALTLAASNDEQITMVSIDLVNINAAFQNALRDRLKGVAPELDPNAVILNTIHTHSAPGINPTVSSRPWLETVPDLISPETYRAFLLSQLVKLIIETWNRRKPSGVTPALSSARVGHNRRALYRNGLAEMYGRTDRPDFIGMESGEDSGIELLFTFGSNNTPTGVIINLACPAQVMEATYKISSDYLGEARRRLKTRFGEAFCVLGQISAAGCQSPRDLTRNNKAKSDFWREAGVTELGRRVATAVEYAYDHERGPIQFNPPLRIRCKQLQLPVWQASDKAVAQAKQTLEKLEAKQTEREAYEAFCEQTRSNEKIPDRPGPYDDKLHPFSVMQMATAVLRRQTSQKDQPFYSMELFTVRLGDIVFVTNPFELFLDYGQQIKARSVADQTFVVQLAGDTAGYLPTARAEKAGGYGAMIGNGIVGSKGGANLVDETVQAIIAIMA